MIRGAAPHERYSELVAGREAHAHVPGASAPESGRAGGWIELPADTIGEVLLQAWWVNGIDYIFFTSGSDIAWLQELTTKLRQAGRPTPSLITMLHENASVNAACGFTAVADRPAATAAHVELGTLNYGDGIHTASRGQHPVMITSGHTPSAYAGTRAGDRGQEPIWKQDLADYGSIVRQYVKWDHELTALENPGLTASRALQVAMGRPRGPAYMSIPRDVALIPLEGARFPSVRQLGLASPTAGETDAVMQAAQLLAAAKNPWMTSTAAGRDPGAVSALVELAELAAIPFAPTGNDRLNFPGDHPLYDGAPNLRDADVVLVVEALVPWIPHYNEPSPEATVIVIGTDPIHSRHLHYEFTADLRISGDPAAVLEQLHGAIDNQMTAGRRAELAERRERLSVESARRRTQRREAAIADGRAGRLTPQFAAYCLAQALPEDTILLSAAVSHGGHVANHWPGNRPGSVLRSGSAGGGWGPGAALGAKLANRDAFVALAIGDGFFQFGVPNAALWAAVRYGAPFLTVVFQNNEWTTGTAEVRRQFPSGASVSSGDFEGGVMQPAPDLAMLSRSVGAWGANVSDPSELTTVLKRAAETAHAGQPAVVAVQI